MVEIDIVIAVHLGIQRAILTTMAVDIVVVVLVTVNNRLLCPATTKKETTN